MKYALVLIGFVIAALIGAVLIVNQGTFVYGLDDPYIHLDLSDMIRRFGLYGVNPGEAAAPSSSILWPFLLAPFAGTPLHPWIPLFLATGGALASTSVLFLIIQRLAGPSPRLWITVSLTVVAALALNLPAMALMGMEHTLQIFLTLAGVFSVLRVLDDQKTPPRWLWVVIFLAPLVRYENTLVSGGLLAILLWTGVRRGVLLCGTCIALCLLAFSGFLTSLGLYPLPASTVVKRFRMGQDYWGFFGKALLPVFVNPLGMVLFLSALLLPFLTLLRIKQIRSVSWAILASLAGASLLHIFIGRYSGFSGAPRYEFYLAAFMVPFLFYLRDKIKHPLYNLVLLIAVLPASLTGLVSSFGGIVRDSHSIYLQQLQLARLVHTVWKGPLAANDVGLIGYRNPEYVLDLIGLSNDTVLRTRLGHPLSEWANPLIRAHGVRLIMLYPLWFPTWREAGWTPVGRLTCTDCSTIVADKEVLFLVPDFHTAALARAALGTWAQDLPDGAIYEEVKDKTGFSSRQEATPYPTPHTSKTGSIRPLQSSQ